MRTQGCGEVDRASTVHGLFEARVDQNPHRTALVYEGLRTNYAELDARANRLAHHLLARDVKPGSLVGISISHGVDVAVALLSVLKAGCAYVLFDPDPPDGKLPGMIADVAVSALIAERCSAAIRVFPEAPLIDINAQRDSQCPAARGVAAVDGSAFSHVSQASHSGPDERRARVWHRHCEVIQLCAAMEARTGFDASDTVLVAAGVLGHGSGLELLWPLISGASTVIASERATGSPGNDGRSRCKPLGLSLFFFAAAARDECQHDGYRLVLEGARTADELGFEAIWIPERHFHEFGGLYPNPSVISAALAVITKRVALRCGSVVAPLHDCIRLAEEWSVVDNLSRGRVGLAFASGWNANDFALAPAAFADRRQRVADQLSEFRRLWRGEAVERVNGEGRPVSLRIFPRPVQADPPIWLTASGSADTFRRAGALGLNLLTHLLDQDITQLSQKIAVYREARERAGLGGPGRVTVMVHAFLHEDSQVARAKARGPLGQYLRSATELWRMLFQGIGVDYLEELEPEDMELILSRAVDRYFNRSGLFGSAESALPMLRALSDVGVDEIACLVDFGVPTEDALCGIVELGRLKRMYDEMVEANPVRSFASLCAEHRVTVVELTPDIIVSICAEPVARRALEGKSVVIVGDETLTEETLEQLHTTIEPVRISHLSSQVSGSGAAL